MLLSGAGAGSRSREPEPVAGTGSKLDRLHNTEHHILNFKITEKSELDPSYSTVNPTGKWGSSHCSAVKSRIIDGNF